jgi:6-phosphogluconolactonase
VGSGNGNVSIYRMNPTTGALTMQGPAVAAGSNPSFLAVDPGRQFLYAVNEGTSGRVVAFSINQTTGALTRLNDVSSQGVGPAHLSVDGSGRWVLVANYASNNPGTVAVLPVLAGGRVGDATDSETFAQNSNPHSIMADPANRFVFVPRKGLDSIAQFRFDAAAGTLTPGTPAAVMTATGAGPRHMDFHPSAKFAYVINEINDTVNAYTYDAANGQLAPLQTISTLPVGYDGGANSCADVHVHPSGKFLYGSNRGHNSIVVYGIDQSTGMLTFKAHQPTMGTTPRNFHVDPKGGLLLAANQGSGTIVSFAINQDTGLLTPTGASTTVNSPAYVGVVYLPATP